jgi:hypothetical protein
MKYLKTYESWYSYSGPEYGADWKVGDIVVGKFQKYVDNTDWILPGEKYEILSINHRNTTIEVKNVSNNRVYTSSWSKDYFMSEKEYELQQQQNKYNL